MASQTSSTPQHCPGFEQFKNLSILNCKCPECNSEIEIFSDEFDKPHTCIGCGKPVDFNKCAFDGTGGSKDPR